MKPYSVDQTDQNGSERRFTKAEIWQDIPVDELWEWVVSYLTYQFTERGAAEMAGLPQATLSNFVNRRTQTERRTLQKLGELYLKLNPQGYWEKVTVPERIVLGQLKAVLPEGEEAALEFVDAVIRAAEQSGTLPQSPEKLREWLRFLVEAEYYVEKEYEQHRRKRRPKRAGDSPAGRTRKKPDADSK